MWQRWQQLFRRPVAWIPTTIAGLLNLATWSLLLINIRPDNNVIVLHYTLAYGADWVGTWGQALVIPAFGLALMPINVAFSVYFWDKQKVYSYFFLVLTPIFELLLLAAAVFLIIANLPVQI